MPQKELKMVSMSTSRNPAFMYADSSQQTLLRFSIATIQYEKGNHRSRKKVVMGLHYVTNGVTRLSTKSGRCT